MTFKVGKVLGDFHLGFSQHLLEVAYAKGILTEEV